MFLGFSDRNIFGRALFPTLPIGETRVFNLLPFDEFGISFSGWSIARRLGANYTGNLIQVRRLADGALLDIGYDANNELDVATLTGFIGADSGFIRTIYDQTGSGNNFVQTTLANQPRIVNAGVLDTVNGKPSAFFDGVNDVMEISSSTVTYKWLHEPDDFSHHILGIVQFGTSSNPNAIYGLIGNNAADTARVGIYYGYDDLAAFSRNNTYRCFCTRGGGIVINNILQDTITPIQLISFSSILSKQNTLSPDERDIGIVNGGVYGQLNSSAGNFSTANASFNLQLGSVGNNVFRLLGYFSELMLYKRTSQDFANPIKIINNQKDFYGIT
jgi:hypothetical protein